VRLSDFAVRRPITTLMILVSCVVLGAVASRRLPLEFMPVVNQPFMRIFVSIPNSLPSQVEKQITLPIEEALASLEGLRWMHSRSQQDMSHIMLRFEWGTDLDIVRTEIQEKLDLIRDELPSEITRIRIHRSTNTDDPILYGRIASGRDLSESYDLLDRKIKRPIERIPGVAAVELDGVSPREITVALRLEDFRKHNLDAARFTERLQRSSLELSLGELEQGERRYQVRSMGNFSSIEQIRNLVVGESDVRLRDVADVKFTEGEVPYLRRLDGEFAVSIGVKKEGSANTVAIVEEVENVVAQIREDPELEGINFLIWFNQAEAITRTLDDLKQAGLFGGILVATILFFFLRRFSTTVVATVAIPFSLLATCGVIYATGRSLNTLTLLGFILAVGMLVDNAVVVMENIFRYQTKGYGPREAARLGAREVSLAVTAATLTSVIVFMPLVFNKPSEMNIYLKEIAITVVTALLASLFVSQTLIPLATSRFIRSKEIREGAVIRPLRRHYTRLLSWSLSHRKTTVLLIAVIVVSIAWPMIKIDKDYDVSEAQDYVAVNYDFADNLNRDKVRDYVVQVEKVFQDHKESFGIKSIYSFFQDNYALTRLYMDEDHLSEAAIEKARGEIREHLPRLPGVYLRLGDDPALASVTGRESNRFHVQLYGESTDRLARIARTAQEQLSAVEGFHDVATSLEQGPEELRIELDRERCRSLGVEPEMVAGLVGVTYRGRRLHRYRTEKGEVEVYLRLRPEDRESRDRLANLPVITASGETVPLASLCRFSVVKGPFTIEREDRRTTTHLSGFYQGLSRSESEEAVTAVMNGLSLPYGYDWSFGQRRHREDENLQELLINFLLALLLVYIVMASLFESLVHPVAIMIALPFAFVGGAWALYLSGVDLDIPAWVGVFVLTGIVVNNGIVLIDHVNLYRRRGMGRREAILQGCSERLRPILMTALSTVLGLTPIVIQKPDLAGVYYYSMAVVIIGGLLISTALTLIVLPTVYTILEDLQGYARRLWAASRPESPLRAPSNRAEEPRPAPGSSP
jgi:HAE1 family hydrophobic/amphiphilic exporter-1